MNWKTTWILVTLALGTLLYITLFERHPAHQAATTQLIDLQPSLVTAVQLRRTNAFILRAEKTNGQWRLVTPVHYPAQAIAIEQLLVALSMASPVTHIPMDDLSQRNQTIADFGLDVPVADLTLEINNNTSRIQIFFGTKTAVGNNVYLQLASQSGIHVVPATLFDRLPPTSIQWRDPRLIDLADLRLDHMDVRMPTGGYEVRIDTTNNLYVLSKPTFARADFTKARKLLSDVQSAQVARFITDDPNAELETLGLAPPTLEVGFGLGTNDSIVVQFGASPPGLPDLVYARRLAQTNIVLVHKSVVDSLATSAQDLRDRHLLSFNPDAIQLIDVKGPENFSVHLSGDGGWIVQADPSYAGDPELVQRWLLNLANLEGVVEKDVVTDFGSYGLAQPARQYILKTAVANSTGDITNRTVDQLDIGAHDTERVYARRASENTVHTITRAQADQLPAASWQLRDRNVWSFTTNDIKSVTLSNQNVTRKLIRSGSGSWTFAPGSSGAINPDAASLAFERLGQLRAEVWVDRGSARRGLYGITDTSIKVAFELQKAATTQQVSLQFGGISEGRSPYALATVDDQSWILEVPLELFVQVRLSLFPADRSN